MAGAARSNLKLVGGNKTLRSIPKDRRVPPWPPLRVVGIDYVPPAAAVSQHADMPKSETRSRPHWTLLWAAGLIVVLAQGIEQAIAAYYG